MKTAKYKYNLIIQQNYGFGWDDNSEYECNSTGTAKDRELFKHDLLEYRRTGYTTRVIKRKELINKTN